MNLCRTVFLSLALTLFATSIQASCSAGQKDLAGRRIEIDLSRTSSLLRFADLGLQVGEVALTFDDGPFNETTPQVLSALRDVCVKAMFFMVGRRAEAAPDLARKVRTEGHAVASHSYSHRNLATLPADEALQDLRRGYAAVETAVFGKADDEHVARLLRLPDLKSTPEIEDYAKKNRIVLIGNDVSPQDWRGDPPKQTLDRLLEMLDKRKKGVVTLHDNQPNTAKMLPMLLAALRERGFTIVQIVPRI